MFSWCCCGPCGSVCFKVKASGCLSDSTHGVPNVVITLKLGGITIGTCTTDSEGECCIDIFTAGSYTWSAAPPAGIGLVTTTGSATLSCSSNSVTITMTLATDLDWICTSCCEYPIYATSLTDAEGTESLEGLNTAFITDNANRTITGVTVCHTPAIDCGVARLFRTTTGNTDVRYLLECVAGEWSLTVRWYYSASETTCSVDGIGNITKADPDWAYSTGTCSAFYSVDHGECEVVATCTVECSADSFYLEATVPDFTEPVYGFTIPPPCGSTVVISS